MIPSYNSARYLRATLESVLSQDPGRDVMQIAVVDDHSTRDDPEQIVRAVAGDRVSVFRQPSNVGHVRNFNTCLAHARGHLVHLLHSDDQVLPGFYRTMERPFLMHPELGSAWCRQVIIDEEGRWIHVSSLFQPHSGIISDWLGAIAVGQRLQAPSMVVRRSVYEELGGFDERIRAYGEDWEMWVRIASRYPAWHEVQPLVAYRYSREASLTAGAVRSGLSARDLQRAIRINRASLPPHRRATLTKQAQEANAMGSAKWAMRMVDGGLIRAPFIQLREAMRYTLAPRVVARAYVVVAYCIMRIASGFARRTLKRCLPAQ
jgi:glycosyltransferase involved in cell wall biosynthesis